MLVTGYTLRESIRRWQLQRDAAQATFKDAFTRFKDEEKTSPDKVAEMFFTAEQAIARLQAAQAEYNTKVQVHPTGMSPMSLAEAVKLVGGAARMEKMWRSIVAPERDRYSLRAEVAIATRKTDEERQVWTMAGDVVTQRAMKASAVSGALRAAIAEANTTKVELVGLTDLGLGDGT